MRVLIATFVLIAPTALVADIAEAPDTVSVPVHYVDENLRPIDAGHLPERIRFGIQPIPGGINGVPLGVSLFYVEVGIGDPIELDLNDIEERIAPIALQMQRLGSYSTAAVVPENVKVVRLGTFAGSAAGAQFNASTGFAADVDRPVALVLVWFDQAVRISGSGEADDLSFEFDIDAPGRGFLWVQYDEYEPDRFRVTNRQTLAEPYLSVEVLDLQWVELEKSGEDYRLLGRLVEGPEHLVALLREARAWGLLLSDSEEWGVGDITRLGPMLEGTGHALLFRDANGDVQQVNQVPNQ